MRFGCGVVFGCVLTLFRGRGKFGGHRLFLADFSAAAGRGFDMVDFFFFFFYGVSSVAEFECWEGETDGEGAWPPKGTDNNGCAES